MTIYMHLQSNESAILSSDVVNYSLNKMVAVLVLVVSSIVLHTTSLSIWQFCFTFTPTYLTLSSRNFFTFVEDVGRFWVLHLMETFYCYSSLLKSEVSTIGRILRIKCQNRRVISSDEQKRWHVFWKRF